MSAVASSNRSATVIALPELGVVSVDGADAVSFLQSQLTNDVTRLTPGRVQLSGYCTPKGRLLATFHQWRTDDGVFLRMPREVIGSIVKRLSMFVLRAKAKVTDVSDAWSTYAVVGEGNALSRLPGYQFRYAVDVGFAGAARADRMLSTLPGRASLANVASDSPLPPSLMAAKLRATCGVERNRSALRHFCSDAGKFFHRE